jgi:cytochrome c oxidase subunit I+III
MSGRRCSRPGFFLLLTIQAYAASVISGVLAAYCVIRWCWFLDHPQPLREVDVGAGLMLRTYASGPSSTGWWAMVITLMVAGMVLTMSVPSPTSSCGAAIPRTGSPRRGWRL